MQGTNEVVKELLSARTRRWWWSVSLLTLALVSTFFFCLHWGNVALGPTSVWRALILPDQSDPIPREIVRQLRLPRALGAICAGSSLALAGLLLQSLFRNPLAGPYVLGVDAGASLGIAIVVLSAGGSLQGFSSFAGELGRVVASWLGALGVLLIVFAFSARQRDSIAILVVGLLLSYVVGAVVTVLLSLSSASQVQSYVNWTFGSFAGITWMHLAWFIPITVIGMVSAGFLLPSLDALALGEDEARSLGISVRRIERQLALSASILSGTVTAFCGPIAFLGVAVPHLARALLRTSDHRKLGPVTVLLGAVLALAADVLCRVPSKEETLPLNAVTSLLGAPVLLYLITRRRPSS